MISGLVSDIAERDRSTIGSIEDELEEEDRALLGGKKKKDRR